MCTSLPVKICSCPFVPATWEAAVTRKRLSTKGNFRSSADSWKNIFAAHDNLRGVPNRKC